MTILSSPLRSILTSPLSSPLDQIGVSGGTTVRTYIVDANGDNIVDLLGNVVFSEIILRESGDLTFLVDENGAFILDEFGNQVITFVKPEGAVFVVDLNGNRLVDEFGNEVIIAEPSVEVFVTNELGYFLVDEEGNRVVVLEESTDAFLIDASGNFIVDLFGRRVVQTLIRTDGLSLLNERSLARFTPASIEGGIDTRTWRNLLNDSAFDLNVRVGTDANLIILESGVALLPGATGDNFSTLDSPAASITGDFDARVHVAAFDFTPLAIQYFVSKLGSSGQRSYDLEHEADGRINLRWSANGADVITSKSTESTGITDGVLTWLRWTLDVDNGAAGNDVTFYTSTDDVDDSEDVTTWTQLGDVVTKAGTTSIFDGNEPLVVGGQAAGSSPLAGKIARLQLFDGIDGTLVVDFDPSKATVNSDTFTSGGVVWTANGDSFVNATGHTGLYGRGSVGLETSVGQLINSPVTVIAVFKPTLAAPSINTNLFDSRSNDNARFGFLTNNASSDKWSIFQGATVVTLSETYDSKLRILIGEFLRTASTKLTVSDKGSVTGDAGFDNWDFGTLFDTRDGGGAMQGLFLELNILHGTLNEEELVEVVRYLKDEYRYVA